MDWEPVILRKKVRAPPKPRPSEQALHHRKVEAAATEGSFTHRSYTPEFLMEVRHYRATQHLTQKELAMKVGVREDLIRHLEDGTGIYNARLVGVLRKLISTSPAA